MNMKRLFCLVYIFILSTIILFSFQNIGTSEELIDWSSDIRLSNTPEDSYRPDIAVDKNDYIHVIWHDNNQSGGIYYKKFEGEGWSEAYLLNPGTEWGEAPSIAVDSMNNIHVAYFGGGVNKEIFYVNFDGTSWSEPAQITIGSGYSVNWMPQLGPKIIADSQDHLYVFWTDTSTKALNGYEISYVYFNGISWSPKRLATNDLGTNTDHFNPAVAVDSDNNIHLVYTQTVPVAGGGVSYDIFYKKYDGTSWGSELRINNIEGGFTGFPAIETDSRDLIHIVWSDDRRTPDSVSDLYYSKLDSNGNILIDNLRITDNPGSEYYPDIFIDSFNNIHIVLQNHDLDNSTYSVRYSKMTNNGEILSDIYLRNTYLENFNNLVSPHLTVDSKNQLHIVCGDNADGNPEIYYRSSSSHDLWLRSEDISFSDPAPTENDEISINADIHNWGIESTNVKVNFYRTSLSPSNLLKTVSIQVKDGELTTASIKWHALAGEHRILVVIDPEKNILETDEYNNHANISLSVEAQPKPNIRISNPGDGSIISDSITITTVTTNTNYVEFYLDDKTLASVDSYPFDWYWDTTTVQNGDYILKVVAYDNQSNSAAYQINITVDNLIDDIPPVIKIINLAEGDFVSGFKNVTLDIDDNTAVARIEIFIDGDLASTRYSAPYDFEWDTKAFFDGEYEFSVIAYDLSENSAEKSIKITIKNSRPYILINVPMEGNTVSGLVEVRGTSGYSNFEVKTVEIMIDSNGWKTAEGIKNWRYEWDSTTAVNGNHKISARAFDGTDYSEIESIDIIVSNDEDIDSNNIKSNSLEKFMLIGFIIVILLFIIFYLYSRRARPVEAVSIINYEDTDSDKEHS